jgi:hypothetical protein
MKAELFVEFRGRQVDCSQFGETAKEIWKAGGNKVKDIKSLQLYYKPEEAACYYIINDSEKGSFKS